MKGISITVSPGRLERVIGQVLIAHAITESKDARVPEGTHAYDDDAARAMFSDMAARLIAGRRTDVDNGGVTLAFGKGTLDGITVDLGPSIGEPDGLSVATVRGLPLVDCPEGADLAGIVSKLLPVYDSGLAFKDDPAVDSEALRGMSVITDTDMPRLVDAIVGQVDDCQCRETRKEMGMESDDMSVVYTGGAEGAVTVPLSFAEGRAPKTGGDVIVRFVRSGFASACKRHMADDHEAITVFPDNGIGDGDVSLRLDGHGIDSDVDRLADYIVRYHGPNPYEQTPEAIAKVVIGLLRFDDGRFDAAIGILVSLGLDPEYYSPVGPCVSLWQTDGE
ncbi:hypothetical protein [Bifidobacterium sp. ESL0764]|uniref:hypothetical protein n=1 Tax=Bifidobacterium sp. ESL0764 TaxID=2983228 RepID=UPI0023F7337C|nr:hypothetical protein [Bifidobacterium sp. ESL0764]WEV65614.1 hypothetical protein OZX71_07670 [Bifidobacterium sp. ESL0764]